MGRERNMDAVKEAKRNRQCVVCGWDGQALAVVQETFVHWDCPRCDASHTGLVPGKTLPAGKSETAGAPAEGD